MSSGVLEPAGLSQNEEADTVLLGRPLRWEQVVGADAWMCWIGTGSTEKGRVHVGCIKYKGPCSRADRARWSGSSERRLVDGSAG